MAVPKRHKTKSEVKKKRGRIFVKPKITTICKNCNKDILPHIVCNFCGFYKGREIIDVLKRTKKREKKQKEKAARQ